MDGADTRQMRFTVEPSPAGGYHVRMARQPGAALAPRHGGGGGGAPRRVPAAASPSAATASSSISPTAPRCRLRPVSPDDKPLFAAAWEALRRVVALPALHDAQAAPRPCDDLEYLTEVDHVDHEAIGAVDPRTGAGLGVARYVRDAERPDAAEAAVAVVDEWQGRGLGGLLLRRLTDRATANGITHLHRLAVDREPQHAAPVRAARPRPRARRRRRHDGDRRRAAGRATRGRSCAARRPGTCTRRIRRVFGLDNLPVRRDLARRRAARAGRPARRPRGAARAVRARRRSPRRDALRPGAQPAARARARRLGGAARHAAGAARRTRPS